jgi:hypothetical protein
LFEKASTTTPSSKMSEFSKDLCQMMVSANIPLKKVSNQQFKHFFWKYINQHIPSESTLQRNDLSACYEDVLRRIRCSVADKKIWVSNDETMDVDGRYVANVVIGTLFPECPAEVFLLVSEVLDRASHSMIAVLFDNTMKLLWPDEVR